MPNGGLFFLDADGRLVGPESAPYPNEASDIDAAWRTLRRNAAAGWETKLLCPDRDKTPRGSPASKHAALLS